MTSADEARRVVGGANCVNKGWYVSININQSQQHAKETLKNVWVWSIIKQMQIWDSQLSFPEN